MITTLLTVVSLYLGCGLVFAVGFVTRGVGALDAAAKGAGIGFRLLIFPGSAAFWPYLLFRWIRGVKSP
jgi:hypothetical protein